MTQNRQPQGIPSGGQFASKTHTEVDITLDDPTDTATAPQWGRDLNIEFNDAVENWMGNNPEGDETTVLELLEIDEDAAVSSYGQARGRWLASLKIRNTVESSRISEDSLDGPGEFWDEGTVEIFVSEEDDKERSVTSCDWDSDYGPDLGYLCRHCDLDENGEPAFDRGHIDWANEVLGRGGAGPWAKHGFRDPNEAVAWAVAGFQPYDAEHWDEAEFKPHEAAGYVMDGFTPASARRDRAIKFAAELADAEADLAADRPVGQPGAA